MHFGKAGTVLTKTPELYQQIIPATRDGKPVATTKLFQWCCPQDQNDQSQSPEQGRLSQPSPLRVTVFGAARKLGLPRKNLTVLHLYWDNSCVRVLCDKDSVKTEVNPGVLNDRVAHFKRSGKSVFLSWDKATSISSKFVLSLGVVKVQTSTVIEQR